MMAVHPAALNLAALACRRHDAPHHDARCAEPDSLALDRHGKIPEFKYYAIRVTLGGLVPQQSSFGDE